MVLHASGLHTLILLLRVCRVWCTHPTRTTSLKRTHIIKIEYPIRILLLEILYTHKL